MAFEERIDEAVENGFDSLADLQPGSEEYLNATKAIASLSEARTNDFKAQAESYNAGMANEQRLKSETRSAWIRGGLEIAKGVIVAGISAILTWAIVKHDDDPNAGIVDKKAYDASTKMMPKP